MTEEELEQQVRELFASRKTDPQAFKKLWAEQQVEVFDYILSKNGNKLVHALHAAYKEQQS